MIVRRAEEPGTGGYGRCEVECAARHWLGAALLEAERYADAERVYRAALADHPHNGWSLFGLKAALKAQGISSPEIDADFEASWARSDTWIRESRF